MVTHLPRLIEAAEDVPEGAGDDHPMRAVTRQVAFDEGWTADRRDKVAALFDGLASEWHARAHAFRLEPLADALDRGGPFPEGLCLELGSGTGIMTPLLAEHFPRLVAADLSFEMLRRADPAAAPRIRADASQLPLTDASVATAVLVNMLLLPAELDRVLAANGVLVWVNTLGDRTPIHLAPDDVERALPGRWDGVASEAGWGLWAVFRRPA